MRYTLDGHSVVTQGDTFIAETAVMIGQVLLKHEASVWWGAVLRGDYDAITIGERSNVQDNCIIHMDEGFPVTIGRQVTIGHKAVLHGCTIGNNVLVGINSVIMNGAIVGDDCLIGSNALITEGREIPPRSLVLGSPGKVVRQLSNDEVADVTDFSDRYVRNFRRYQTALQRVDG